MKRWAVAYLVTAMTVGCVTQSQTRTSRAHWAMPATQPRLEVTESPPFELRVDTPPNTHVNAPAVVTLHLRNRSNDFQRAWLTTVDWDFHFEVVGPNPKAAEQTDLNHTIESERGLDLDTRRRVNMPPRSELVFDVDLTRLFDLSIPGEYLLIAQFRPLDPEDPTRMFTARTVRFSRIP